MSQNARSFGEGYRDGPLEVETLLGVEHLKAGQYEAIWTDDERTAIELSFVHQLGHSFIVLMLNADSLRPIAMIEAGVFGVMDKPVLKYYENLSEPMLEAVARLKTSDVKAA